MCCMDQNHFSFIDHIFKMDVTCIFLELSIGSLFSSSHAVVSIRFLIHLRCYPTGFLQEVLK